MNYKIFGSLYMSALKYDNIDCYIAEQEQESCMDKFSNKNDILEKIYKLAHSTIKELRGSISRAEFSRIYKIPIRTLEDWDSKKRRRESVQVYLLMLLSYTIFMDNIEYKD